MCPSGSHNPDPEEGSEIEDAKGFLRGLLIDGPVSSRQIRTDAEGAGSSWRTIQRAKKALAIEALKEGMKGAWVWKLPTKSANNTEERHAKNVAAFGNLGALRKNSEEHSGLVEVEI